MLADSQSSPSYRPSPVVAHVLWMYLHMDSGECGTRCKEGSSSQHAPVALFEGVQAQLVSDVSCIHCIWQILLVGEHKQHCISQLLLPRYHHVRLFKCLIDGDCWAYCYNYRTSFNIRCSSSRASPIRSLSLLSTTNTRPCVFCTHQMEVNTRCRRAMGV
jgi:hypothetical protein